MTERRGDITFDRTRKLVVLSGGQDSTTCLFQALHDPTTTTLDAVSFDYGQRHSVELHSAAFVYELARIEAKSVNFRDMRDYRYVVNLPRFKGKSPLTNPSVDLESYAGFKEMTAKLEDRVELTFVSGRNVHFLLEACKLAAELEIGTVVIGVNEADAGNYPDCQAQFIALFEKMWQVATRSNVAISAPLQGMSKEDIVELATKLPGCMRALAFTTTDYDGAYPPSNNHASVLRRHGFAASGHVDPLIMRAEMEGLL
jgi:7-cyano-7-deazaguanine synthase